MKTPIYFDYSATTPVDPRVAEKMCDCLTLEGNFGNPASRSQEYGWKSEEAVENARKQVADLVNADPKEIVFTSGATESNNLGIKGVAHFYQKKGKHIITCKTEHKAVLDSCRQLEREGFEVTYLDPETNGLVDLMFMGEHTGSPLHCSYLFFLVPWRLGGLIYSSIKKACVVSHTGFLISFAEVISG